MDTLREEEAGSHDKLLSWGGGISGEETILARWGKTVKKIKLAQIEGSWGTAQILGLDAFSWRIDWADVWAFRCIGNSAPQVRITTRGRRQAVLSPLHNCITVNDDGELVTIKAEHLQPGRSLIPLAIPIPKIPQRTAKNHTNCRIRCRIRSSCPVPQDGHRLRSGSEIFQPGETPYRT